MNKNPPSERPDEPLSLPFRPRARLLQLLGDQLIGSARLAVFELVKNAYDADAETVTVTLQDMETPTASILVVDDGEGMSLDVIRDIWLVPGHDHRERQRKAMKRTSKGRLPLGEKGVGRFAAHKLGNRIEVITRSSGHPECVVEINWASLIAQRDLSDALVEVSTRDPAVFRGAESGTRIRISELRDDWTRGELRRLQRQITAIASPFGDRSDRFTAKLEAPGHDDWLGDIPDATAMLQRALWTFHFRFDKGRFDWEYRFLGVPGLPLEARATEGRSERLLVASERELDEFGIDLASKGSRPRPVVAPAAIADGIGPVEGHFHIFDRDREVLNLFGESQLLQHYLNENGGVRIYRDAIRVYNYGEPDDDWLGLDLRRINKPTHFVSRNIVIGAIDLSLAESSGLQEKTNREGFVENDVQRRLKQIVLGAITPLEAERWKDKERIRALTSTGRSPETRGIIRPLEKLHSAAQRSENAAELARLIKEVERDYNELKDTMLRAGLSGVGLAVLFHEVEHGVRQLCALIESGAERAAIRLKARELARVLDGLTELLRKGPSKIHSLSRLVRRGTEISSVRFDKHKVRLHCPAMANSAEALQSNFSFGLALGALNNLIDNSIYWLKVRWPDPTAKSSGRAIHIGLREDLHGGPAVVVADNGPGFQDPPADLVRPFFSRRPRGMGLGLYYANLVMELCHGRLVFPDREEARVPPEFDGASVAMVFPREASQ